MLSEIRRGLDLSEPGAAYYPGTQQRLDALWQAEPAAEVLGGEAKRLFVANVDPASGRYGFRREIRRPS
jgi:DNA-binding transcriptional LysR family regulator